MRNVQVKTFEKDVKSRNRNASTTLRSVTGTIQKAKNEK